MRNSTLHLYSCIDVQMLFYCKIIEYHVENILLLFLTDEQFGEKNSIFVCMFLFILTPFHTSPNTNKTLMLLFSQLHFPVEI